MYQGYEFPNWKHKEYFKFCLEILNLTKIDVSGLHNIVGSETTRVSH